jgi:hypothetical protein
MGEEPKTSTASYTFQQPKPKIYYVRESAAQSIVADIFTFGILILITTLNFMYWGGHWYMGITIIILWFVFIAGRAKSKIREFTDRSALVDHLIKELKTEGETSK